MNLSHNDVSFPLMGVRNDLLNKQYYNNWFSTQEERETRPPTKQYIPK